MVAARALAAALVWLLLGRWLGVALALAGAPAAGQAEPGEGRGEILKI